MRSFLQIDGSDGVRHVINYRRIIRIEYRDDAATVWLDGCDSPLELTGHAAQQLQLAAYVNPFDEPFADAVNDF